MFRGKKPETGGSGPNNIVKERGRIMDYNITVNGKLYNVNVEKVGAGAPMPTAPVAVAPVAAAPTPVAPAPVAAAPAPTAAPAGAGAVTSPMPGNIFKVECSVGQTVNAGDVLIILEAMKMEIEVNAPSGGTVQSISATVGTAVNTGDVLVTLG